MRTLIASLFLIVGTVSSLGTSPSVKSNVSDWILDLIPDNQENSIRPVIENVDDVATGFLWGFAKLDMNDPLYCFTDGFPAAWAQNDVLVKYFQTQNPDVGAIYLENAVPLLNTCNPLTFGKGLYATALVLLPDFMASLFSFAGQDLVWVPLAIIGFPHLFFDVVQFASEWDEFLYHIESPDGWAQYVGMFASNGLLIAAYAQFFMKYILPALE